MLQMSKILNSRDEWRTKAKDRAEQLREYRKANSRQLMKISALQTQIDTLAPTREASQKNTANGR